MKHSAGLLLFRRKARSIEVLLGHMGGPYWARRDEGAWTIPKGEIEAGEDPLKAAIREFEEEIGKLPEGSPFEIGTIRQKSGKLVSLWALEGEFDPTEQNSNMFTAEWPPKSGNMQQFPEIDRVEWMLIDQACSKAIEGQAEAFRELERLMRST